MSKPSLVIPSTRGRDTIIVVCGVCAAFALGIYAVVTMGAGVTENTLTGTIVKKEFRPLAEEQFTIGQQGLHARHSEGDYILEVRVADRTYNVWVDKTVYGDKKNGDNFAFPRPSQ